MAESIRRSLVTGSHHLVVRNYNVVKQLGRNEGVESEGFDVGGFLWKIVFYPTANTNTVTSSFLVAPFGTDQPDHPNECVFTLGILDQSGLWDDGSLLSDKPMRYVDCDVIQSRYVIDNSITIGATVGFYMNDAVPRSKSRVCQDFTDAVRVPIEDDDDGPLEGQVDHEDVKIVEKYEAFDVKMVVSTSSEEDTDFHIALDSVIVDRYLVKKFLESAAEFSQVILAHDLQDQIDVSVRIIKNNNNVFVQSLREIKQLNYVSGFDHYDNCHLPELYDHFYYRDHLFMVSELLSNLSELHELLGLPYFSMPRLQSFAIQCLKALEFLHRPGSICFEAYNLRTRVQSSSYSAPEIILGLPYNKKIDIWSLGCTLAELCTGNVLFENGSPATLLAQVIGTIGPIDPEMLKNGRDTYKCFTKSLMLYERNQDTNRLEYLIPKKSSLTSSLGRADRGFIDFEAYLLQINPSQRPSASEALAHPWLQYNYFHFIREGD